MDHVDAAAVQSQFFGFTELHTPFPPSSPPFIGHQKKNKDLLEGSLLSYVPQCYLTILREREDRGVAMKKKVNDW